MSIEKKCENCSCHLTSFGNCAKPDDIAVYCISHNYDLCEFSEDAIRKDEQDNLYKLLSKVCLQDNVKYGFQLDGKDYLITRVGYIDTYEKMIRDEERYKIITDLENEIQNFNEIRDSKTIDFIQDFIKELKEN